MTDRLTSNHSTNTSLLGSSPCLCAKRAPNGGRIPAVVRGRRLPHPLHARGFELICPIGLIPWSLHLRFPLESMQTHN